MESVWNMTEKKTVSFPRLEESIKTDVLVVGGGIAGLLCAYMLKKAGVDCVLIEAKEICSGVTKNTTAKITVQHGLIYGKLTDMLGRDGAGLYLEAQTRAADEYSRLCSDIPCDYEKKDSFVYSLNGRKKIEKELKALDALGAKADFSRADALPFHVEGAVRMRDQAQFHPLKFAYGLSRDLPIYENTKIIEFKPNTATTANCEISFKKLIIATHFPIMNKHGGYFIKMYQHRSYVIALENAADVGGMYVDDADTGMSFRNYKNLLFIGGGDHRTGKNGGNWRELEGFIKRYYGDAKESGRWATQDCMTLDGIPYIGEYSKNTPGVYVATGFNKWGMTSAMVSATVLCDLICGRENKYKYLFSPSRSILHPQLALNAFETIAGLVIPTVPRCPHLGCALKYNRDEHSWDCPCHGSRFTEDGELIDNPATDDIKQ